MKKKVQIEQLWRIKLSHLKPLLNTAKELRLLPPEEKKRRAVEWRIGYKMEGYSIEDFSLKVRYFFKPRTHLGTGEEILEEAIRFIWDTPTGEHREQDIELEYRESNLGKGDREYYFRDKQYNLCRVLYSDRWGLYSRAQLRGRAAYKQQQESRTLRKYSSHLRAEGIIDSVKGRHFVHRGKATPFAYKVQKALDYLEKHPFSMESALIPKKRGRKPAHSSASAAPQRKNIAMY